MFDTFSAPSQPLFHRWFTPGETDRPYLRARWIFLRCLGFTFCSGFYALWFQIEGLIGPRGILPFADTAKRARQLLGWKAYWLLPTLYWVNATDVALRFVVAVMMKAQGSGSAGRRRMPGEFHNECG